MATINISKFEDSFILYFRAESTGINANTLGTILENLNKAAQIANGIVNPGYEIELVVEAIALGSFKVKIKGKYKRIGKYIATNIVIPIILHSLLTGTPNSSVNVTIKTDEVIIQHEDTVIIVPRNVHDRAQEVQENKTFRQSISRSIKAVERDPDIFGLGISETLEETKPLFEIPREKFIEYITTIPVERVSTDRIITTTREYPGIDKGQTEVEAKVIITKAILMQSQKNWEFSWNGWIVHAPILDEHFWSEFKAHKITIAPGDELKVKLRIYRHITKSGRSKETYKVVKVIEHIPSN